MYLIYRSAYEGPQGKWIRHFPEPTVYEWFRRLRSQAPTDLEALLDWLTREIGVDIYGLASIFQQKSAYPGRELILPGGREEFPDFLRKHLYVERRLNVGEGNVRALTDDDDIELAFYLLDDDAFAAAPDRWAYLGTENAELPTDVTEAGGFTPPDPVDALTEKFSGGEGATYLVVLDIDGIWFGWSPMAMVPGVRLPGLTAALRDADKPEWDGEFIALRALISPGDSGIRAALERRNLWPFIHDASYVGPHSTPDVFEMAPDLTNSHPVAHAAAMDLMETFTLPGWRFPDRAVILESDHLIQATLHVHPNGFRQFYVFDDLWAAAHPGLAASIMHAARHWDPLCDRDHARLDPC
ncbi:hypothetical protein [Herbidospora sp. RD11066]